MLDQDMRTRIDNAIQAHALWKVRLIRAIEGIGAPIDRKTAGDCHACVFGQWLDGDKANLARFPGYEQVYELHRAFHADVGAILGQIQSGSTQGAKAALSGEGELRVRSSRLVSLLLRWKL